MGNTEFLGVELTWYHNHVSADYYSLSEMPSLVQLRRDNYQAWKEMEHVTPSLEADKLWANSIEFTPWAVSLEDEKNILQSPEWFLRSEIERLNRAYQREEADWKKRHPNEECPYFVGYGVGDVGYTTLVLREAPAFLLLSVSSPIRQFRVMHNENLIMHCKVSYMSSVGTLWPRILLCFKDGACSRLEVSDVHGHLARQQFELESPMDVYYNRSRNSIR